MTYKIVDWTGKQLFNKTFKNFDSAWEFIDSLGTNYGYFEENGDFISELWVIPKKEV